MKNYKHVMQLIVMSAVLVTLGVVAFKYMRQQTPADTVAIQHEKSLIPGISNEHLENVAEVGVEAAAG